MSDDNEQLRAELARVTAECDEACAELLRRTAECDEVRARGRELRREVEALRAERDRARAEGRVDGLREALDYARTEEARLARACDRRGISHEDLQRLQGCRFTADEIAQAIEAMLAKGGGA